MTNRVIPYVPQTYVRPPYLVEVPTAWGGVETILFDVMKRFTIFPGKALEFGVDYGYSTSALANYFNLVIGVDTFEGDHHAGYREDLFNKTSETLKNFKNVVLTKSDYKHFIRQENGSFDLIHIDIVHDYKPTAELGRWAIEHSNVVMFHDTISFPDVRRAVQDIAWESGRRFYEYQEGHGVGFLVKE